MKNILPFLIVLIVTTSCFRKLSPTASAKKLGPNFYVEVDGKALTREEFLAFDANTIALVNTIYGKEAIKKYGTKAKDGAVIASTQAYARKNYEAFFSGESEEYKNIISQYKKSEIQYILNDHVLKEIDEGSLALINRKRLISITFLNSKDLLDRFQIMDKKIGVSIKAKPPKDLYNSKKAY